MINGRSVFVFVLIAVIVTGIIGAIVMHFLSQASPRIKRVYVVFTSHIDTGFDRPMDEMERRCKSIIDDAINKCLTYSDFHWTIENMWQLETWLSMTTKQEEVKQLFRLIADGKIEVGAAWDDVYTGFLGYEDINRLFYPAKRIEETYNVSFNTVIMDDLPGYSWALPQALNRSGLKYFLTGINCLNDYWGSGTSIPLKDLPFYWEGPDGSRVLTWISFGSYTEGLWLWGLSLSYTEMCHKIQRAIQKWEEAKYPFDAILVMHAHDSINCTLAVKALENMRRWNAEGNTPRLIAATPSDFFKYMEEKYGGQFKAYSGDWTSSWDAGKQSLLPRGTAMVRWARDHLTVAEKIWSINSLLYGETYPSDEFNDVYRRMFTWLDHTESAHTPDWFTREEMERDVRLRHKLANISYTKVKSLLQSGFERLVSSVETIRPSILVFNPLSWSRTGLVRIRLNETLFYRSFELIDTETNISVPYQKVPETLEIVFIAERVPSIGYKKYEILFTETPPVFHEKVTATGNIVENDFYKVTIDANNGYILSIIDKRTGRELVNQGSKSCFNQLCKLNSSGWTYSTVPTGRVSIKAVSGPVFGKLIVERGGSPFIKSEYILYSKLERIDVVNYFDYVAFGSAPHYKPVYYYIACPFNLSIHRIEARSERANYFLPCSGEKHLPGAYKRLFYNQHCLDLNEGERYGVTVSTRQTYVNTLNDKMPSRSSISPRRWAPTEATWLELICSIEDLKKTTDQGVVRFNWEPSSSPILVSEYSIRSYQGSFNPINASRLGWEFNVPLLASYLEAGQKGPLKSSSLSFFNLDKQNIQIITIKKAEFGDSKGFILRLQEISGNQTTAHLYTSTNVVEAKESSILEEDLDKQPLPVNPIEFTIQPYQTLTIRVNIT